MVDPFQMLLATLFAYALPLAIMAVLVFIIALSRHSDNTPVRKSGYRLNDK